MVKIRNKIFLAEQIENNLAEDPFHISDIELIDNLKNKFDLQN